MLIERNMLCRRDGSPTPQWSREKEIDPVIRDFRLLQYDIMFGKRFGESAFFPEDAVKTPADTI